MLADIGTYDYLPLEIHTHNTLSLARLPLI